MEAIKIGLDIEPKNLKETARNLKSEFKSLMSEAVGKDVSTQFNSMALSIEKTIQKSDILKNKLSKIKDVQVPTDEFKDLQASLKATDAELQKLYAKKDKQLVTKGVVDNQVWSDISAFSQKAEDLRTKIEALKITGANMRTIPAETTEEYKRLSQSLALTNTQLDIQMEKWWELGNSEQAFSRELPTTRKAVISLKGALQKATSAAIQYGKAMTKIAISKFRNFFKGGSKDVDNMSKSFKRGLTKIFAYGFGIRSLFRLFNKLRGYAKDALGVMSKQFDDVNRDMSALASKFSQLKNSFGTLAQPIIHALLPALLTLMNVITAVNTKIAEFIAVLTGQKYIYKATEANIDYAKSLDDSTKSTKKNTKAVKDNQKQLGYYDKLNVIGQDDDKDKTPDYGGVGDNVADNVQSGFEKADPTKAVSEFAKKVKEAWKKADFTEIGNIIGTKLKNGLEKIPWDSIKPVAEKIGKSLGTLINGFVEVPGLGSTIGKSIAEGLNTAFLGLNTFLKTVKWESVSKFITDGLNSAIKAVDWKLIGETFANGLNAQITLLSGFFNDTDWSSLGSGLITGLGEFIKNLDTKKISSTLSGIFTMLPKLLNGAMESIKWDDAWETYKQKLVDFLNGIDFKDIASQAGEFLGNLTNAIIQLIKLAIKEVQNGYKSITEYFNKWIEKCGGDIVVGILAGIVNALKNIGKWIEKNILSPFVKGFGKAFGIKGSSSEIMKTIGTTIMKGFEAGLKLAWKGIKAFIKALPGAIKTIFSGLKSFFRELWSGIKSIFSNVGSFFSNAFSDAWKNIKSIFSLSTVKTFFNAVLDGIKSVFMGKSGKGGIIKILKDAFTDAWKAIKGVFSKGGELFEGIKNGVADTFSSVVKSLLKGINSVIKVPFEKINDILEDLKDVKIPLPKPLKDIKPFTFVKTIPVPQIDIPGLAQGAVIPPNREFLAMLGDQKQGTNIETPLDTMIQAFNTALAQNNGATSHEDIVLRLDGRDIAKAVWDEDTKKYKQTGAFMPRYS